MQNQGGNTIEFATVTSARDGTVTVRFDRGNTVPASVFGNTPTAGDRVPMLWDKNNNRWTVLSGEFSQDSPSGDATPQSFFDLTDTPSPPASKKYLTWDGSLQWTSITTYSGGATAFTDLTDTPASMGAEGDYVIVSGGALAFGAGPGLSGYMQRDDFIEGHAITLTPVNDDDLTIAVNQSAIDHGSLAGLGDDDHGMYAHIEGHTGARVAHHANRLNRTVTAGAGLQGGGSLASDVPSLASGVTLNVHAQAPLVANADNISLNIGRMLELDGSSLALAKRGTSGYAFVGVWNSDTPTYHNTSLLAGDGLGVSAGSLYVKDGFALKRESDQVHVDVATNFIGTDAWSGQHLFTNLVRIKDTLRFETDLGVRTITTDADYLKLAPSTFLLLSPGGDQQVRLDSGVQLRSWAYTSQTEGFAINDNGSADFRYLYVDEMHAKAFIADLEQALAGGQFVSKSVAMVAEEFNMPSPGGTVRVKFHSFKGFPSAQVFQNGDMLMFRNFNRLNGGLEIGNAFGTATWVDTDSTNGTQRWDFTRLSGTTSNGHPAAGYMSAGTTIHPDSLAIDFGVPGNGYYEVSAIDGWDAENSIANLGANAPYAQVVTWAEHPWYDRTARVRMGNLRGMTNQANEYGLYAKHSEYKYLRASDYAMEIAGIPIKLFDGSNNEKIRLDPGSGSPYFAMNQGIALGFTDAVNYSSSAIWMGMVSGNARAFIGDASDYIRYDGTLTVQGKIIVTAGSNSSIDWGTVDGRPADEELLNSNQTWADVSGAGKPADNATVGADWFDSLNRVPNRFGEDPDDGTGLYLTPQYMGYYWQDPDPVTNGDTSRWLAYIHQSGSWYFGGPSSSYIEYNSVDSVVNQVGVKSAWKGIPGTPMVHKTTAILDPDGPYFSIGVTKDQYGNWTGATPTSWSDGISARAMWSGIDTTDDQFKFGIWMGENNYIEAKNGVVTVRGQIIVEGDSGDLLPPKYRPVVGFMTSSWSPSYTPGNPSYFLGHEGRFTNALNHILLYRTYGTAGSSNHVPYASSNLAFFVYVYKDGTQTSNHPDRGDAVIGIEQAIEAYGSLPTIDAFVMEHYDYNALSEAERAKHVIVANGALKSSRDRLAYLSPRAEANSSLMSEDGISVPKLSAIKADMGEITAGSMELYNSGYYMSLNRWSGSYDLLMTAGSSGNSTTAQDFMLYVDGSLKLGVDRLHFNAATSDLTLRGNVIAEGGQFAGDVEISSPGRLIWNQENYLDEQGLYLKRYIVDGLGNPLAKNILQVGRDPYNGATNPGGAHAFLDLRMSPETTSEYAFGMMIFDYGSIAGGVDALYYGASIASGEEAVDRIFWSRSYQGAWSDGYYFDGESGTNGGVGQEDNTYFDATKGAGFKAKMHIGTTAPAIAVNASTGTADSAVWVTGTGSGKGLIYALIGSNNQTAFTAKNSYGYNSNAFWADGMPIRRASSIEVGIRTNAVNGTPGGISGYTPPPTSGPAFASLGVEVDFDGNGLTGGGRLLVRVPHGNGDKLYKINFTSMEPA